MGGGDPGGRPGGDAVANPLEEKSVRERGVICPTGHDTASTPVRAFSSVAAYGIPTTGIPGRAFPLRATCLPDRPPQHNSISAIRMAQDMSRLIMSIYIDALEN